MTLYVLRAPDDVLAVRFACSPVWETMAAVRTFADRRARSHHEGWHRLVHERSARLDLSPLLAVPPPRRFVPDFLTPPPPPALAPLCDPPPAVPPTSPAPGR